MYTKRIIEKTVANTDLFLQKYKHKKKNKFPELEVRYHLVHGFRSRSGKELGTLLKCGCHHQIPFLQRKIHNNMDGNWTGEYMALLGLKETHRHVPWISCVNMKKHRRTTIDIQLQMMVFREIILVSFTGIDFQLLLKTKFVVPVSKTRQCSLIRTCNFSY